LLNKINFLVQYNTKGFTLIELMVVIVIIAVIASFTTLSLGKNEHRLVEDEAKKLAALLALNVEEAILYGEERGISFHNNQYYFYTWRETWIKITQDDVFYPRTVPENIQLQIDVEKMPLEIVTDNTLPQIWIASSGELVPFTITLTLLTQPTFSYQIQGLINGTIQTKPLSTTY